MCLESMDKEEASDSHMGVCVWKVRGVYVCVYVCLCTSVYMYFCARLSLTLSVGMHMDLTLLHSSAIVSFVTELKRALDHSSNAFALAQDCHKIELHLSWWRSVVERHRKCRHSEALEIAAAAAVAKQQAGMATADLMTLQQQIRQEIVDSLQRVREGMHTAINGRLDAISSISGAMQGLSAGPAETANPCRVSDLIPKSWDGSHDKGQFRNFMAELYLWMQVWSDQGDPTFVRAESVDIVDRSTLAVDCTEADFRTFESLCTRFYTGQQQANHRGWFNTYRVREDSKLGA